MQTAIQFDVLTPQNNRESEQILLDQAPRLSNNCKKLYAALKSGKKLSGVDIINMGMIEYRARIRDLRRAGIIIQEVKDSSGCKTWYL